jgi:hypothetical protein
LFSLFNINTTSYKIKDPKSEKQLNETSDLKNKIREIDLLYKEGIITIDKYKEKRKQLIEKILAKYLLSCRSGVRIPPETPL